MPGCPGAGRLTADTAFLVVVNPRTRCSGILPGIIRDRRCSKGLVLLGRLYDRFLANADTVASAAAPPENGNGISVAIAHYNRGRKIFLPLRNLVGHPLVREVVILDDGSAESEYESLCDFVSGMRSGAKIHLHRRKINRGALVTKYEAVELCRSKWVLVLDSDNTAFRHYLDRLCALEPKREDTLYGAAWAFPYFPFHELAGTRIDAATAAGLTRSGVLKRVYVINDGNYLVPRDAYVRTGRQLGSLRSDVADVMLFNYLWLSNGGSLEILPGTSYFHRVDSTSFWARTQDASRQRVLELFARIESSLPCDPDYIGSLQAEI